MLPAMMAFLAVFDGGRQLTSLRSSALCSSCAQSTPPSARPRLWMPEENVPANPSFKCLVGGDIDSFQHRRQYETRRKPVLVRIDADREHAGVGSCLDHADATSARGVIDDISALDPSGFLASSDALVGSFQAAGVVPVIAWNTSMSAFADFAPWR